MRQALTPSCPFCAADALDIPRTPFEDDETPSDYLCAGHLEEETR